MSSAWHSGDVSGDVIAGGRGWISLGTTTRSLPRTKIAPALFAVPAIINLLAVSTSLKLKTLYIQVCRSSKYL